MNRFWTGMVLLLLLGCDEQQSGGSSDVDADGGEGSPAECPALASACPDGCDAIDAASVALGLPASEQCRHEPVVLGCYVRPEDENDEDACVIDEDGNAYGVTPSEAVHLVNNGYDDCTPDEISEWTEVAACSE